MEEGELLMFISLLTFLTAALVITYLNEKKYERNNKQDYIRVNQKKTKSKRRTKISKDETQNKSEFKGTKKKKRKPNVKKNETTKKSNKSDKKKS